VGVACLLTLLALAGVVAGVRLGQVHTLSTHVAAAGGGLLFGIALFWVVPEMAEISGWTAACVLPVAAGCAMLLAEEVLIHSRHSPREGLIAPLLAATAIHSFLDGWSVRALAGQPLASIAVPLGLGLHKVPEGMALGWIARRAISSPTRAALVAGGVELLTVAGALVEPRASESGAVIFGAWWNAGVLAVISGSFLFLGFHALLPSWRRPGVVVVFLASLTLVGLVK